MRAPILYVRAEGASDSSRRFTLGRARVRRDALIEELRSDLRQRKRGQSLANEVDHLLRTQPLDSPRWTNAECREGSRAWLVMQSQIPSHARIKNSSSAVSVCVSTCESTVFWTRRTDHTGLDVNSGAAHVWLATYYLARRGERLVLFVLQIANRARKVEVAVDTPRRRHPTAQSHSAHVSVTTPAALQQQQRTRLPLRSAGPPLATLACGRWTAPPRACESHASVLLVRGIRSTIRTARAPRCR